MINFVVSDPDAASGPLCVGTVKGPGETPNEYCFIAPDPEQRIKHGEFVYYLAEVDGERRQILGRVTARTAVRLFPDTFMADPTVEPRQLAELLGLYPDDGEDRDLFDLFEITVAVLGYHHPALHDFINPRIPPQGGSKIYIADDDLLISVLSKRRLGDRGSAHLGSLLSRAEGAVPVALDVRGFTSTHLAIIASTGSGKSYLAGVLLEELMMPHNRAAVLVIDPHGEYNTLQDMQNQEEFRAGVYKPTVRIFRPEQIRVSVDSLTLADLRYLLPNLSEKMHHQLTRGFNNAQKMFRVKGSDVAHYTLEQLLMAVVDAGEGRRMPDEDTGEMEEDPTTNALRWRLGGLRNSTIFNDFENMELDELFRPGQCTVVQLNEVDRREQQVIAAVLLRRVYQARINTAKKKVGPGEKGYLPFPVFCLMEEAHNFAPASADAVSTDVLKQILSEGRKFGVSIGLITQRPGKLDSDVLSQCMTQCIMRITNPFDQDRISQSVESVGRDLLRELSSLSKGQVIVSGASVNTPVLLRVRTRITRHGGEDQDAPEAWAKWFDQGQDVNTARDTALIAAKQIEEDEDGMLWA